MATSWFSSFRQGSFGIEQAVYRLTAFGHDGTYSLEQSSGDVTGADPTEPLTPVYEGIITID